MGVFGVGSVAVGTIDLGMVVTTLAGGANTAAAVHCH